MSSSKINCPIVLRVRGNGREFRLPIDVFSSVAEQLRWDALRTGNLKAEHWSQVQAFVSPVYLDDEKPTQEFAFAITLKGDSKDIRRVYRPAEIQRLRLYVGLRSSDAWGVGHGLEIHWYSADKLQVPLAPAELPLPLERIPVPEARQTMAKVKTTRLLVTDKARKLLAVLYQKSLAKKTELGGALLGSIPDLDTTMIRELRLAPSSGASEDHFSFEPRFWLEMHRACRRTNNRVVGWAHSHLCKHRKHPRTLSVQDLVTSYSYFNSPWLLTVLVCASPSYPDVKWFGWTNGSIVEQSDRVEYVSSPH